MLSLAGTDVLKRLAKKLLAFGDCYLDKWLMARICNGIDTWGWIFIVIITRNQTLHCRLLKYITPLKIKEDGHFRACCCKILLHVNRCENRKKGSSVKILRFYTMLWSCFYTDIHVMSWKGVKAEGKKQIRSLEWACRGKFGVQKGGNCDTAGGSSKTAEVHL